MSKEHFVKPMIFNPKYWHKPKTKEEKLNSLKDELYFSKINRRLNLHNRMYELKTNPFYNV